MILPTIKKGCMQTIRFKCPACGSDRLVSSRKHVTVLKAPAIAVVDDEIVIDDEKDDCWESPVETTLECGHCGKEIVEDFQDVDSLKEEVGIKLEYK